jgi:hypothetical protein
MIKGRATLGGKPCVVIGLSRTNCERLLANQPIVFDGEILGWPGERVVILGGETEPELLEDLRCAGALLVDGVPQETP